MKRYYLYLNKKQKIKSRMRDIITFMLEKIKSRMRDIVISLKKIKFRKCRDFIIFFEESIVNENRFQVLAIEFMIVRMMILKQSKKKNTFSKT
jgi:hypothetical protein